MKRNFLVGFFGSLIGFGMLFILLSAAGLVGAALYTADRVNSAEIRSARSVSRANEVSAATPLTSTFTYQGQLKNGGNAVNGSCQMAFRLYDDPSAGILIGSPIPPTVPVTNGLFTVGLNFGANGNVFNGSGRWLQIAVRCPPASGYTPLNPRQPLTAAPYAFALPGLYTQPNATSPNIIGGYSGNVISSTVVGGVIGGGGDSLAPHRVQTRFAPRGGGYDNPANGGSSATVSGGEHNTASGSWATVPGGFLNTALGDYSFAAGRRAKA